MSRVSLITPEIVEKIATALSQGVTRETAVRYAHISYQTFYNWRERGKKEHERISQGKKPLEKEALYLDFFNQIEDAETDAIIGWQLVVNQAMKIDPSWAFKMLQLREPRGYRTVDYQVTTDLSAAMQKATDEQLQRIANGEDPFTVLMPGSSNP